MFIKCGNPACGAPFRNSERGGIFLSDSVAGLESTHMVQVELTTGGHPVYFFWLCDTCCRSMTCKLGIQSLPWDHPLFLRNNQPPEGFARTLVTEDRTLIESRCERCGVIIRGSVLNGLHEAETAHRANCPVPARAADSGATD